MRGKGEDPSTIVYEGSVRGGRHGIISHRGVAGLRALQARPFAALALAHAARTAAHAATAHADAHADAHPASRRGRAAASLLRRNSRLGQMARASPADQIVESRNVPLPLLAIATPKPDAGSAAVLTRRAAEARAPLAQLAEGRGDHKDEEENGGAEAEPFATVECALPSAVPCDQRRVRHIRAFGVIFDEASAVARRDDRVG